MSSSTRVEFLTCDESMMQSIGDVFLKTANGTKSECGY